MLTLSTLGNQTIPFSLPTSQTAPLSLSTAALAEAEAAHAAQGLRIQHAHEAHARLAAEAARMEAETV